MRKEGTIVRWDAAKGFGFIRGDSVGQDIFVPVRDYRADIPKKASGQKLRYAARPHA